jgi:hypothetical protein
MKLNYVFLGIFVLFASCSKPNSENMNLDGALEYSWETSIEEIKNDFKKKNYSNIEFDDSSVMADMVYQKIPASIYAWFYNEQIYSGGVFIRNTDDLNKEDFHKIENKFLLSLEKKYGKAQGNGVDTQIPGAHEYNWNFKNNCTVKLWSMFYDDDIMKLKVLSISFINNELFHEKEQSDK